jgi:hypothetical protein
MRLCQGPGESCAKRGDGRGERSGRADITGLGTTELQAEADPMLLAIAVLKLGVLDTGFKLDAELLCWSPRLEERRVAIGLVSEREPSGEVGLLGIREQFRLRGLRARFGDGVSGLAGWSSSGIVGEGAIVLEKNRAGGGLGSFVGSLEAR